MISIQIGAAALFALPVLGRPLLYTRPSLVTRQAADSASLGNFGICPFPEIEFGVGFDNRKETAFQPVNQTAYDHGSADGIAIIMNFMCDQLVNFCQADSQAQATCASATTTVTNALTSLEVSGQADGGQADLWNAQFGITTNFADVPVVTDQGTTLGVPSGATTATASAVASSSVAASTTADTATATDTSTTTTDDESEPCVATVTVTVSAQADVASSTAAASATDAVSASATAAATSTSFGDFGTCPLPEIEFGDGFDNRKETAFQPADQTAYNHGSADNIGVITQFMCNNLVNSCGADSTAQATCAAAITAVANAISSLEVDGQADGAQADLWNAQFGITTNFAAVAVVSNTGTTLGVPSGSEASATAAAATASAASATASAATASAASATVASATAVASSTSSAAVEVASTTEASSASSTAAATSSSFGNFGSCPLPQIEFGDGFDNRKETAFQPVDQTAYNHGSADNIGVITQFMCNTLVNTCGADSTAQATCAAAITTVANAVSSLEVDGQADGAQADLWNAQFGITTNFADVAVVSNTGTTLGVPNGSTSATASAAVASA